MTAPDAVRPGRAAFTFIFVTVVIDMLALGIVIPVLPSLILEFRGGNTSSAATLYGLFGSVFALMQFVCSPLLGSLSDRFGRRRVILLSCTGLGLDYILMAMAPSLWWLFVGRVISGVTSSTYGTAGAYIADVTPPEQRAAKFGMLGVAFGIGFIVGPSLGGVLAGVTLRAPFWGAAILSLQMPPTGSSSCRSRCRLKEVGVPMEERESGWRVHMAPVAPAASGAGVGRIPLDARP